jgi:hypothetical protein
MGMRDGSCRLLGGLVLLTLLGGCASGASPTPAPATPTPTPTPAPAPTSVPSAAVLTPAPKPTVTATTAPTPTPTAIAYGPASVVSGIEKCNLSEGTVTTGPGDTLHSRGGTVECVDQTNDPRVNGTFTGTFLSDRWGSPIPAALVQWGTVRLVNAGGTWEGSFTGVYSADRGDIITYWWTGTGGYDGLAYFEQTTGTSPWPIRGMIFPGDPPNPTGAP